MMACNIGNKKVEKNNAIPKIIERRLRKVPQAGAEVSKTATSANLRQVSWLGKPVEADFL